MKIVKMNYSASAQPWRLLTAAGAEVMWQRPFDHPNLGMTWISEPVCGYTKVECTEKALQLLGLLMVRQKNGVS